MCIATERSTEERNSRLYNDKKLFFSIDHERKNGKKLKQTFKKKSNIHSCHVEGDVGCYDIIYTATINERIQKKQMLSM